MKPQFFIITLMPDFWHQWIRTGIMHRLRQQMDLYFVDLRFWGEGRHKAVDGRVCGGTPGMVLRADILQKALEQAVLPHWGLDWNEVYGPQLTERERALQRQQLPFEIILPSPRGVLWNQHWAKSWAADIKADVKNQGAGKPHKVIICPRYEGIDERFHQVCVDRCFSLGDMILSGGDLPAAAMIDSFARCLPGLLGNEASLAQESFEQDLLDHPHYTKPLAWNGLQVPPLLTQGNHALITSYWHTQRRKLTAEHRPDLWKKHCKE